MKSLADKLHARKFKLGLYINLGTDHATCGRFGSYGNYVQDAKTMGACEAAPLRLLPGYDLLVCRQRATPALGQWDFRV